MPPLIFQSKETKMDMETLMAQAHSLQEKISAAQEELSTMHVKGIADNGLVIVDMTGKYDVVDVKIDDRATVLGAVKLSELVQMAYTDAKSKADKLIDKTMSAITGSAE